VDALKYRDYLRVMEHELDAIGLLCPLPVLKARKRLMPLASGDRLRVRTDDPAAVVDVPHFCKESGNRLISASEDSGIMVWVIEKA
jgi:tRNA 2-thiouridine synthesizing protein A